MPVAVTVGGLPVSVAAVDVADGGDVLSERALQDAADGSDLPGAVALATVDHATAEAAGAAAGLRVARADGGAAAATVDLSVSYAAFAHGYGGDYGARLRAVLAPACALTTPDLPECATRTQLASGNNAKSQSVTARVELPAQVTTSEVSSLESGPGGLGTADAVDTSSGEQVVLLEAGTSSPTGTFTKSSLSSALSWQAGTSSGAFSTSYKVTVPPVPGSLAPDVTFGYSSSSVDGRTNAESAQSSWLGEGWSYEPGYIERTYRPCAQDTDTTRTYANATGDLCWNAENATLVWGGKSTPLVLDGPSGAWTAADSDGSKIDKYAGLGNYGEGSEAWRITTPDGTQYNFGMNRRPGWTSGGAETFSAWNVPVFANHSSDRCYNKHGSGFANSWCVMTWRWNLDYVVDPAGNSITYFYDKQTPKTGMNGSATNLTYYDRGGNVSKIEYGVRAGQEFTAGVKPVGLVEFTAGDRCLSNCWSGTSTPVTTSWPDVPWDLDCYPSKTSCPENVSPSFWSYRRLAKVTTKVWDHTLATPAYVPVDEWALTPAFPATGESATDPALWLNEIVHTGLTGSVLTGTSQALPAVRFGGNRFANRAGFEAVNTGVNIMRYRLTQVFNEFGGLTAVTYEGSDCGPGTSTPDPDWNPRRCFPQQYTVPGGSSSGWTWWNKLRVTQVKESDLVGGQPDVVHTYAYTNDGSSTDILWHHNDDPFGSQLDDRSWSDFRGWTTVISVTGTAGSGYTSNRKQLFFRGLHLDRTDSGWGTRGVMVTDSRGVAWPDSPARAGSLLEDQTINPATLNVESGSINFPFDWTTGVRTITGAQPPNQTAYASETGSTLSQQRISSSGTASYRKSRIDYSWDQTYDRVLTTVNHGLVVVDASHPDGVDSGENDETCTSTQYADTTAAWMTNRVSQSVVYASTSCTGFTTNVVKNERYYYDQQPLGQLPTTTGQVRGLLTKTEALVSWDTRKISCPPTCDPNYQTVAETEYDVHGRPVKITDALGRITTTAYVPAQDKAVTSISVTNPKQFSVTTGLDLRRGLPLTVTDANSKVTTGAYDPLGRLISVWQPGTGTQHTPDVQYAYFVRADAPSYTRSTVVGPNGNLVKSFELLDGLGRTRQTQTPVAAGGMQLSTTNYDARGLATSTSSIHYTGTWAEGTIYTPTSPPSEARYTYDGLGRKTTDELWSAGVKKWTVATTTYQGDRTIVDTASGGTDTITDYDVFGRTIALWQTDAATLAGTPARYQYDRLGQLIKTIGPDLAEWTYGYDLRGRKTTSVDPDSGTTTTNYDAAGQITKTVDGRGQVLTYTYDQLGRKTGLYNNTDQTAANQLAGWTYDTVPSALGQLGSASRYIGGNQVGGSAYTQQVTGYNDRYQPLHTDMIIPTVEGALGGTYGIDYSYNGDGSLATQTTVKKAGTTAVGGLPEETLTYTYNTVGQPTGLSGAQTYIADTAYTYDGLPAQQILGAAGKQVRHTYAYDIANRRLNSSQVDVQDAALNWVDKATDEYGYDNAGNVQWLATKTNAVRDQAECFDYDYLRRLAYAWTEATLTCDSNNKQKTGAAPYRFRWDFDAAGNRTNEQSFNADGSTQYQSTYAYGGTGKPLHSLASVTTVGTGAGTKTYDYDAAGNTTSRPGPGGAQQTLTWNEEGKLVKVADSTDTTMVYGASGDRILRRDPGGYRTLYLPDGSELRANGSGAVAGTRYYVGVAVRTANVDSSGNLTTPAGDTLTWTITDHHGTGNIVIDATSLTCQRRRSLPYGDANGAQPGGFGSKGFVGGTSDPTGLTHVGAREYDPALGRFISVDSIFDASDPQSWNGYAYANSAPVTSSDSSGLNLASDGGGSPGPAPTGNSNGCLPSSGSASCNGGSSSTVGSLAATTVTGSGVPYKITGLPDGTYQLCIWNLCISQSDVNTTFGEIIAAADDAYSRSQHSAHGVTDVQIAVIVLMGCAATNPFTGRTNCASNTILDLQSYVGYLNVKARAEENPGNSWAAAGLDLIMAATDLAGARGGCRIVGAPGWTTYGDSFAPDTQILMADGSTKAIVNVAVGDDVYATDPESDAAGGRVVSATHVNRDTGLTDVTVRASGDLYSTTIHTTTHHPFWDESAHSWVYAADLARGHRLLAVDGSIIVVVGVRSFLGSRLMYNLTVEQLHTYYVLAGSRPVLVHNCPDDLSARATNPKGPGESSIWKNLNPFKGKVKSNGLNGKARQYYQWDYTHNDIEVYNSKGIHLGSMDPVTGEMYKPAVEGRTIEIP